MMNYFQKYFTYFYSLILAIHVIFIAQYMANIIPLTAPIYEYYEGTALYFNAFKKNELLLYVIGIVSIGSWFLLVMLLKEKIERHTKYSFLYVTSHISGWITILFLSVLFPILIYKSHLSVNLKLFFSFFLIAFCIEWIRWFKSLSKIVIMRIVEHYLQSVFFKKGSWDVTKLYKIFILIAYMQLIGLFYEPIFHNVKIITEYFNINETSIIQGQYINKQDGLSSIFSKSESKDFDDGLVKPQIHQLDFEETSNSSYALTEQDRIFLQQNDFELHWQILSRFMIHHNSFVYIPMKEFELNKPVDKINAQYGLGFPWLLNKIFEDGMRIDQWLRFSYSLYYVYFLVFIALVQALSKDWRFTGVIFLLSLAMINNRGYDFLLLPPGESPWRHFFDLWVIYFIYTFGKTQNALYYWLALIFGIVSIFINPQIGLMIFVSVVLIGMYILIIQKRFDLQVIGALIISIALAFWCFQITNSASDLAQYYIDGVIGFPIKTKKLIYFLLVIVIGYLITLYLSKRLENKYLLPLIFLFFYSQELLVYVVWHYNSDGLKARAFIYILTIGLMFFYFAKTWPLKVQNILWIVVTAYALNTYVASVIKVQDSREEYNHIFETHKTYTWDMENAKFLSTMDPKPFENDVNLVRKYATGNGIHIVSEYDNILPFLSDKYSLMPFFDLKWYLITPKEVQKSVDVLKKDRPEYIFVDTGIDRNLTSEIIDINTPKIGYLHQESIWRIQRLQLLNKIFHNVSKDYELIEKGSLISVYKKKEKNENN